MKMLDYDTKYRWWSQGTNLVAEDRNTLTQQSLTLIEQSFTRIEQLSLPIVI